jgi:hypothetical protein
LIHSTNAKIKKTGRGFSALPLFVTRILADDPNHTLAADHLAIPANALHRR